MLLVMTTLALLLTLASPGEAWQVNIKNSCNKEVWVTVQGHHLFWLQPDCFAHVAPGQTVSCKLPGAICPKDIGGYSVLNSPNGASKLEFKVGCTNLDVPCCWNVNVEVVQNGENACDIQRR